MCAGLGKFVLGFPASAPVARRILPGSTFHARDGGDSEDLCAQRVLVRYGAAGAPALRPAARAR